MKTQLDLLGDVIIETPSTESIKYAGSKLKLLPHILQLVNKVPVRSVLDGFCGTTRVAQALAKCGYRVIASDIAVWSKIFGDCYLRNHKEATKYQDLIDHLNSLDGKVGWFTKNYGGITNGGSSIQEDGLKKPWQIHNTMRLDAIRDEIDNLNLEPIERSVALTSLILALDKVDSTLGHFVSYLNKWSPRSYNRMVLKVPYTQEYEQEHQVIQDDVFNVLNSTEVDLAYFDPPYGSNNEKMPPSRVRYASYYHLWTTICKNDKPKLYGKARRRKDTSDKVAASVFEEFRRDKDNRFIAVKAIEKMLRITKANWILLSYSSGGRATACELNNVIHNIGKLIDVVEINYRRNVMAGMKWTEEWIKEAEEPNVEFLFLIEKS